MYRYACVCINIASFVSICIHSIWYASVWSHMHPSCIRMCQYLSIRFRYSSAWHHLTTPCKTKVNNTKTMKTVKFQTRSSIYSHTLTKSFNLRTLETLLIRPTQALLAMTRCQVSTRHVARQAEASPTWTATEPYTPEYDTRAPGLSGSWFSSR